MLLTALHGRNLFGFNDFMQSRDRSADFGFDLFSNVFLITSFMFLSHLKSLNYSSLVEKTSCDTFASPTLLNALVNFSFFMTICIGLTFPFPKNAGVLSFPRKAYKPGSEEIF